MEFRQIHTFKCVATVLNFNRAARVLNYAQSTVSAHIKALEEDFGVPLFDRLGKRVVLTKAGQQLLRYADKLLAIQDETYAQVGETETTGGTLSLRVPQSIATCYLPQIIERFGRQWPHIGLDIDTCAYHSLEQELKTGITDLAFLLADGITSRELHTEVMRVEPLVISAAPHHPLVACKKVRLEDLAGQTLLMPKHDCAYRMMLEQQLRETKVRMGRIIQYNGIQGLKQCLRMGIGIALLPEITVREELDHRELVALPWSEAPFETALLMIWHKDKWISPALKGFMEATCSVINK